MATGTVRSWLKLVLSPYPQKGPAFIQIDQTLASYPSLSPKTDSFTFDDGRTTLLICLSGTIPVEYRGSSYNIPIAIWIPHEFPQEPPMIFVTPTKEMIVRKGSHVEPGGRCIGGYLDSWTEKPQACSLNRLLEYLQDVFSREPPLYAKPKPPPVPVYSPGPQAVPTPSTSGAPATSPSSPSSSSQPVPPPRPPLPNQDSRPRSGSSAQASQPYRPPPPPPSRPPPPPIYSKSNPKNSLAPSSTPVANPPIAQSSSSQTAIFSRLQHGVNPSSLTHETISRSQSGSSYTYQHREANNPQVPGSRIPRAEEVRRSMSALSLRSDAIDRLNRQEDDAQHRQPQQLTHGLQPAAPQPSRNFLDELDDDGPTVSQSLSNPKTTTNAPPPRPPNPALLALREAVHRKIQDELDQLNQRLRFEHEQLIILQHDLLKGEPAIMDEMARLQAVRDVCGSVGDRYEDLVKKLKERNRDIKENRKIVPVDELVCSTTVLYNQLWELITEDQAIDDTIYHLARALNNSDHHHNQNQSQQQSTTATASSSSSFGIGTSSSSPSNPNENHHQVIDLDKFLRRIRALGREQFLKRCMINKISKSLGFI